MRNYVIINGINSLTIPGLAIRNLPPISKPAMRTMTEEIDGRDGDIITKLGYAAYDKTLEIGLYGEYDINQIIAFFNTEGEITFSDESDKVYNFQILNQIDYEALIKFRSASVTLHCQPFKYPLTETPFEKTIELINGNGTIVALSNTAAETFPKFDMKGNTSQASTPNPYQPVKVDVVSGNNEITISDGTDSQSYNIDLGVAELLDFSTMIDSTEINGITFTNNGNGTFSLSGTATANTTIQIIPAGNIKLEGGLPYYLYCSENYNNATFNFSVAITDNGTSKWITANSSLTPTATPTNVRLQFYIASGNSVDKTNVAVSLMQASTRQRVSDNPVELCKIGTAQDYFYKEEGNWYKHEAVKKKIINGTEAWTTRGGGTSYAYALADFFDGPQASGLCDRWYFYAKGATNSQTMGCVASANTDNRLSLFTNDGTLNSVANLKTWFTTHNTTIYYTLATPEEIQIIDGELIAQLEEIQNATSYENTTNITQTNNDLPFILDVAAVKKGSNTATIINEGNIYSKPIIDIVGTGTIGFYIDGIQKLQLDMNDVHEMIIDTEAMEAYNPITNQLTNRLVTGDYSKIKLDPGENELSVSGNITRARITKYTRWL